MLSDDDKQFVKSMERYCSAETQRLCRIIRELQAEIENAPVVFSGPQKGLGGVTEEWSRAEFEGDDTHRARLVRIEKLEGK